MSDNLTTEADAIEALVTAIDGVVEAWEGGDLAGAVRYASAVANEYRTTPEDPHDEDGNRETPEWQDHQGTGFPS